MAQRSPFCECESDGDGSPSSRSRSARGRDDRPGCCRIVRESAARASGGSPESRPRPAEGAAGVGHHVALSVVGTDRLLASGYFREKMAQENLIKASKIPFTIVRATQFFEFVGGIAQFSTEGATVRLPSALMQPIVSDDVAAALADVAIAEPLNDTVQVAGPEPIRMDELIRRFLSAKGDPRKVITDVRALYYGIEVNDQSLVPGDNPRLGPTRFEDWLSQSIPQK